MTALVGQRLDHVKHGLAGAPLQHDGAIEQEGRHALLGCGAAHPTATTISCQRDKRQIASLTLFAGHRWGLAYTQTRRKPQQYSEVSAQRRRGSAAGVLGTVRRRAALSQVPLALPSCWENNSCSSMATPQARRSAIICAYGRAQAANPLTCYRTEYLLASPNGWRPPWLFSRSDNSGSRGSTVERHQLPGHAAWFAWSRR